MGIKDISLVDSLKMIGRGLTIHENSWDADKKSYGVSERDAMTSAAGGDENLGNLLFILSYNSSNDIQSIAEANGIDLFGGE